MTMTLAGFRPAAPPALKGLAKFSATGLLLMAVSAAALQAHTDAVGFQISPGTSTGQYNLDFYYGSWHSGSESTVPEGGLAVWQLTPTEAAAYRADPVANANIGTQIVGDSMDNIDDPLGNGDSIAFQISNLFDPNTDYSNSNLLPAGFTPGLNYFYSATDSNGNEKLIGSAGADLSSGSWTDSTGMTWSTDSVWGHQVASIPNLLPGTYRFYYDALDPTSSATWDPTAPIQYVAFTIDANGNLTIPGVTNTPKESVSVLERVLRSVNGVNANKLNGIFANIAENYPSVDANGEVVNAIDGHIVNTMTGLHDATAQVSGSAVEAIDNVTVDIGMLSTTVLGAVNTGDITVGANQDVAEAMTRRSSAVSNALTVAGGSTDFTTLQLNIASNSIDVLGSVTNTMSGLDGSIEGASTTVLGAVNTGTISSGVGQQVTGIVSGIVGG